MHEGEEAEKSVVVGIEVAILEGDVLGVPESIDKLLALVVAAEHRGSSSGGYESDTVAQLTETTCLQDLIALRQCSVGTILIHKGIDTL